MKSVAHLLNKKSFCVPKLAKMVIITQKASRDARCMGFEKSLIIFSVTLPNYLVFFMMFLGLVFVYGIGYFWVSRDINKNHDIVRMGIIGKLIVFVALLWAWVDGEVPVILVGAGIVDLIFTILFIKFLNTYKQMETK